VTLTEGPAESMKYLRKMNMQLASKMRFISAQLLALYGTDLWLTSAAHANAMAAKLSAAVQATAGVELVYPTESNGVFAALPNAVADRLRERFRFYDWDRAAGQVRWMCSFDTTEADVDSFVAALGEELAAR
jgi:threonine aldolase